MVYGTGHGTMVSGPPPCLRPLSHDVACLCLCGLQGPLVRALLLGAAITYRFGGMGPLL